MVPKITPGSRYTRYSYVNTIMFQIMSTLNALKPADVNLTRITVLPETLKDLNLFVSFVYDFLCDVYFFIFSLMTIESSLLMPTPS